MPKQQTQPPTFSEALRARILEVHLSNAATARVLDVHPSRITRYLSGDEVPNIAATEKWARFLHVPEVEVLDMIRRHGSRRGSTNSNRSEQNRIRELEAELDMVRAELKKVKRELARALKG
jgi:transcriptional regulator with XRE-family HTH domain